MAGRNALTWQEWGSLDATAMAGLVRQGEVSAAELAMQAAAACETINPVVNAVIEVFEDVVADPYRDGLNPDGPFHGVPTMLKDLGSRMRGRRQENGYAWQENYVAGQDDPLTENWRHAGFNLIGRTTTPEDGMSFVTDSLKFGKTRNPWNTERASGGSSGGSSAAVAAGILPLASASDGGGSIRFPAAWTGLVGLKPSRGLNPMPAGTNELIVPAGVEGLVARSVRDCATVHDQLRRKPRGTGFMAYPAPATPFLDELSGPSRRFRIGVCTSDWSRSGCTDPLLKSRVTEMSNLLENMGHNVEVVREKDICDFEALFDGYQIAHWKAPLGVSIKAAADSFGIDLSTENTSVQALNHVAWLENLTLADYFEAQASNALTTRQWGRFWDSGYDLLLTPLSAIQCPNFDDGYELSCTDDFDDFLNRLIDAARYTIPANETGMPAISIPAGVDANGCPCAVQFTAPWTAEFDLIHIGAQLEKIQPDRFGQKPPVHVSTA